MSEQVQEFACGPTKICSVCGSERPVSEFRKNAFDVREDTCRICQSTNRLGFTSHKGIISREEILDRVADKLILRMGLMKNLSHKAWQKPMQHGELEEAQNAPRFRLNMMEEICCGAEPEGMCKICKSAECDCDV